MKFIYTTDRLYLRTLDERSADKILEFYNAGKDVFSRVESEKPSSFYTLSYQATLASMEFKAFLDGTYMRYYLFDITDYRHRIFQLFYAHALLFLHYRL